ncbi:MAG: hypothetical protein Q9167_003330 [Letrouitia subvulpina]
MGVCFIFGAAKGAMGPPSPVPVSKMSENEYLRLFTLMRKLDFILSILIVLACGFVKLSIIFLLRRIFLVYRPSRFGYITAAMVVLITAWTVTFFFAEIFSCGVHINGYWSTQEKDFKHCSNIDAAVAAFVISSVITDLMTLILPIPMVWKLNLSTVKKIQVTGVFLLGLFAVAASVGRMAVVLKAASLNRKFYPDPNSRYLGLPTAVDYG